MSKPSIFSRENSIFIVWHSKITVEFVWSLLMSSSQVKDVALTKLPGHHGQATTGRHRMIDIAEAVLLLGQWQLDKKD